VRKRFTKAERQKVYEKYDGHCAYCGCEIEIRNMQIDHLIPMMFYEAYQTLGQDLNDFENLMPSCRSCNNYKHSLTLEKFREAVERWPEVLQRDNKTYRNAVRFGVVIPNPKKIEFYFEREKERPPSKIVPAYENVCVTCGAQVPEGRQICPQCEKDPFHALRKKEEAK